MSRPLIVAGRLSLILPAIVGVGLLTWISFLYPGLRMAKKSRSWLYVAYAYSGLAVLLLVLLVAAPSEGPLATTSALILIVTWLSGIVLYIIMLKTWLPFSNIEIGTPTVQAANLTTPQSDAVFKTVDSSHVNSTSEKVDEGLEQVPKYIAPARVQAPREGTMVFISHASKDRQLAINLSKELEVQGIQTWLAYRNVGVGANYAEEIVKAIVSANYLLVVLSEAAIESPHVRREVTIGIDRGVPLLPVNMSASEDFMWDLPVDWTYWLSLAQVLRHTDESTTAMELARRINR